MKKLLSIICAAVMLSSNAAMAQVAEQVPVQDAVAAEAVSAENTVINEIAETAQNGETAENSEYAGGDIRLMSDIFDGGDGSVENPFLISTETQLVLINDFPSYSFKLLNDIELADKWSYVGSGNDKKFSGVFDGDGYCISGLTAAFVYYNYGTIKNLRFNTTESIVYVNYGTIENCCSEGAADQYGAFVDYNCGTIQNCYSKGSTDCFAGFVYCNGKNNNSISYSSSKIINCYCVGEGVDYGFVCNLYSGTITNCYYDKQVSEVSDTNGGTQPKNTLAMKMKLMYTDWDFENTWGIDSNINDGYPYLLTERNGAGITGITLSQSSATMAVGETLKLTAAIEQEDETERDVNWSSSNDSVVSVSGGLVTAKSIGSATITASVGNVSAECVVTVADNAVKVTGIVLDNTSLDLVINETATLKATVLPTDATNKSVTWQNLNPDIVSFNQSTGEITALSVGTARIIAKTADGGHTADCAISVYDDTVKVVSVSLDKSETGIGIGEQLTLKATVLPENATNKTIKWSSLNSNVATVSDKGVVTGISEGTTQIYATSSSNSACYAICRITVAKNKVAVTGIELDSNVFGDAFEVDIGKTLIFSPTIKPNNATNKATKWTSSDESIAKVDNGVVTGLSAGTVTITVTTVDGGYSAGTTVKVCEPVVYVTGITVNKEQLSVPVKGTAQLLASVLPVNATDKAVKFESNNNAIATVSSEGVITGVSQGTTLIKAISETSTGRYVAFCTVTVPKPVVEVTSVKLDKSSLEIVEGKTVPLKAVVKPTNATYKTVTWSVGDESIATVSQDGYITAQGVGETVVSATTENGKVALCNVTVLSIDTPAQLKVEDATVKAGKQVPITVSIAANPGISSFMFDLKYDNTKMYPVSYELGDVLEGVQITTPLGTTSHKEKTQVRFLCMTQDSKNLDTDGDLIKVTFQTLADVEMGEAEIEILPSSFINQNNEEMNLQKDNCTLSVTDYIIGDVNNDDKVDLKDSMLLAQYISGFDVTLSEQGKKAAVAIYPDENTEPTLNDLQHLFRYLSDWQVELGKKSEV